ncbi:MAG TPA: PIN domain-containing protein [Actinomycetota bacterium]
MIYLDTSAFVKLVQVEQETPALESFLSQRSGAPLVSSALLVVEARRAALRASPSQARLVDSLLTRVSKVEISDALIEAASRLPDPMPGS